MNRDRIVGAMCIVTGVIGLLWAAITFVPMEELIITIYIIVVVPTLIIGGTALMAILFGDWDGFIDILKHPSKWE